VAANSRGDAARAALVESAERLFAERGIEGVSLRDVSAAACQRNHSAAQYHFGDRLGLVAAVYEHRMAVVDVRRRRVLDDLDVTGLGHDLAALVDALVRPLVEVVAEVEAWYARFLARTRWEPDAWRVLLGLPVSMSFLDAGQAMNAVLASSGMTAARRRSRLDQLGTLLIGTLAGWEGAPARGERRLPPGALADELAATGLSVLTAPVPDPVGVSA
jgi:AcrR family transcriptional regulator